MYIPIIFNLTWRGTVTKVNLIHNLLYTCRKLHIVSVTHKIAIQINSMTFEPATKYKLKRLILNIQ